MISEAKIKQSIIDGENLFVEFKERLENTESLAGEIVALANTEGGVIIFGVNDKKQIIGIDNTKKLEENISNIVRQNIEPPLSFIFKHLEIDNKKLGILQIDKSISRPYQTHKGIFYIRVGTSKRKVSREELGRIYQDVGQVFYDLSPVENSSLNDIDKDKVNAYFHKVYNRDIYDEQININELFKNLKFLTYKNNKETATVGGLLLFGKNPQDCLSQASIKVVRFAGAGVDADIIDSKDISGALDKQIDEAENFIKRNMKRSSHLEGVKRIYKYEYPLEAVREIIVNAVAHRNYSITGSKIRLMMFDDRLEVISPGRLPNTVTLENLPFAQSTRNQLIVRVLLGLGYIEELGTGINKIIKLLKRENNTEPKFEVIGEEFKVTIYN